MTPAELKAFAQSVVDGGPVKKSEVVAFMKAYLEPQDPTKKEAEAALIPLYFEIQKTGSGIHVPREANRSYTKAEATSLLAMIAKALE